MRYRPLHSFDSSLNHGLSSDLGGGELGYVTTLYAYLLLTPPLKRRLMMARDHENPIIGRAFALLVPSGLPLII